MRIKNLQEHATDIDDLENRLAVANWNRLLEFSKQRKRNMRKK